mgnify:CR=1 FL=1
MHPHIFRHVEKAEDLVEHGNNDGPAADAEHPGKQARDQTRPEQRDHECNEVGDRNSKHDKYPRLKGFFA